MISNTIFSLAELVGLIITIYIWLVIIRVVLSWINVDPYNQFVRFLVKITEPPLARIRAFVPLFGGLDISPIILIFALYLVRIIIVSALQNLAVALR